MGLKRDIYLYNDDHKRVENKSNNFGEQSYTFEETDKCLLTIQTESGPFYLTPPVRRNITEDQKGIGLLLGFKIVDAKNNCKPIDGASVDVWQVNAYGEYSGFLKTENLQDKSKIKPTNKKRFLRGRQYSDNLGFVEFETIFPGKYDQRTNHIHIKISLDSKELLNTQIFFPQEINDYVQSQPPYNTVKNNKIKNSDDFIIIKTNGAKGCWPKISPFGKSTFTATLTIGVSVDE